MLTAPMKIILALVVTALCATGFYLLDWQGKYARLEQETKNLADAQAQLDKAKEDLKQLPELTKQMEAKEEELDRLVGDMAKGKESPDMFVANYLAELERLVAAQREQAADEGFAINSITPGEAKVAKAADAGGAPPTEAETPQQQLPGLAARTFQMQMTGRYGTLVDFLYQLGALKLDRLVTINKISLSPSGSASGGDSPTLSISIPVTAYMRGGS